MHPPSSLHWCATNTHSRRARGAAQMKIWTCNLKFKDVWRMFEDTLFSSLANLWGMSGTSYTYLSRICFYANNGMTVWLTLWPCKEKGNFLIWYLKPTSPIAIVEACLSKQENQWKSAVSNITPVLESFVTPGSDCWLPLYWIWNHPIGTGIQSLVSQRCKLIWLE